MEFKTLGDLQNYFSRLDSRAFHTHLDIYGHGGLGAKDIIRRGSGFKRYNEDGEEDPSGNILRYINDVDPTEITRNKEFNPIELFTTLNSVLDENTTFTSQMEDEEIKNLTSESNKFEDKRGKEITIDKFIDLLNKESELINRKTDIIKAKNAKIKYSKMALVHGIILPEEFKRDIGYDNAKKLRTFVNKRIEDYNDLTALIGDTERFKPLISKAINNEKLYNFLKVNWPTMDKKTKINLIFSPDELESAYQESKAKSDEQILKAEEIELGPFPHVQAYEERNKLFERPDIETFFKDIYGEDEGSILADSFKTTYGEDISTIKEAVKESSIHILDDPENYYYKLEDREIGDPPNCDMFENLTVGIPLKQPRDKKLEYKFEDINQPKYNLFKSVLGTLSPDTFKEIFETKGNNNIQIRTVNLNYKYTEPGSTEIKIKSDGFAPLDNLVDIKYTNKRGKDIIVELAIENKLYDKINLKEILNDNDTYLDKVINKEFIDFNEKKETLDTQIIKIKEEFKKIKEDYENGDITKENYKKQKSSLKDELKEIENIKPTQESIREKFYKVYYPKTIDIKYTKTGAMLHKEKERIEEEAKSLEEGKTVPSINNLSVYDYAAKSKFTKTKKGPTLLFDNVTGEINGVKNPSGTDYANKDLFIGRKLLFLFGLKGGRMTGLNYSDEITQGRINPQEILKTHRLGPTQYKGSNEPKKKTTTLALKESDSIAFPLNVLRQIKKATNMPSHDEPIIDTPVRIVRASTPPLRISKADKPEKPRSKTAGRTRIISAPIEPIIERKVTSRSIAPLRVRPTTAKEPEPDTKIIIKGKKKK